MKTKSNIEDAYKEKFGHAHSTIIFAPGRANIIGEHTDYNDGFVLPFAIDKGLHIAIGDNNSDRLRAYSESYDGIIDLSNPDVPSWANYIKNVFNVFQIFKGYDVYITSSLPIGAGLSSSSALCCGCTKAISIAENLSYSDQELLQMAIRAERGNGLNGGIMDQFTIFFAKQYACILLDCLKNDYQYIPLPTDDFDFIIINSNVSHQLELSGYNNRVEECGHAFQKLQEKFAVQNWQEVDLQQISDAGLSHSEFIRSRHIIEENQRVHAFVKELNSETINPAVLGSLLYSSHESLSRDYQVSCEELDWIVDACRKDVNIYGARMMGGGFGGSVIAIVKKNQDIFIGDEQNIYSNLFHKKLDQYVILPERGMFML